MGNLLADEALWRAGIDPRRRGVDLDPDELARLRRAVRAAIRGALAAGGTGRSPFARSRALGICPRHGSELSTAKVGGRTTRWCPLDAAARQRRPRRSGSSAGSQVRPTRNGPKRP